MYNLIADSGSTKTDWVVLHGTEVKSRINTIGFNPYFQTSLDVKNELVKHLKPELEKITKKIETVYFYGAGCSSDENCSLIKEAISQSIDASHMFVSHDLLAAARALCQREWGIAAILGTGSNSCLYNGNEIIENVPSTGYLWSDYGGGSQIGKFFIKEYFEGNLDSALALDFEKAGYNREVILQNVYKKGVPSKYLASLSPFITKHIKHPNVIKILESCFDSFFEQQINKYTDSKKYKVHTVGSIGFYYKDLIAQRATKHGYKMGTVIKSPIEGLIEFHSKAKK